MCNMCFLTQIKYREDYQNKVKGKWSQTPCYEIAVARMNSDNLSDVSIWKTMLQKTVMLCLLTSVELLLSSMPSWTWSLAPVNQYWNVSLEYRTQIDSNSFPSFNR